MSPTLVFEELFELDESDTERDEIWKSELLRVTDVALRSVIALGSC